MQKHLEHHGCVLPAAVPIPDMPFLMHIRFAQVDIANPRGSERETTRYNNLIKI